MNQPAVKGKMVKGPWEIEPCGLNERSPFCLIFRLIYLMMMMMMMMIMVMMMDMLKVLKARSWINDEYDKYFMTADSEIYMFHPYFQMIKA